MFFHSCYYFIFTSGLKLYYGSSGYSDGLNIASDLNTNFLNKMSKQLTRPNVTANNKCMLFFASKVFTETFVYIIGYRPSPLPNWCFNS